MRWLKRFSDIESSILRSLRRTVLSDNGHIRQGCQTLRSFALYAAHLAYQSDGRIVPALERALDERGEDAREYLQVVYPERAADAEDGEAE